LDRSVLRDDQWERIAPLLPGKVEDAGRSGADNRLFVEAVLWIVRVGAPWRDLPEAFGNWNFQRFRRWVRGGVFNQVFAALEPIPVGRSDTGRALIFQDFPKI
jgi:transposase